MLNGHQLQLDQCGKFSVPAHQVAAALIQREAVVGVLVKVMVKVGVMLPLHGMLLSDTCLV